MNWKVRTSLGALAVAIATPAFGQVEEITVTAQKREQNVQEVPIAISAFTADALEERADRDDLASHSVTSRSSSWISISRALISALISSSGLGGL